MTGTKYCRVRVVNSKQEQPGLSSARRDGPGPWSSPGSPPSCPGTIPGQGFDPNTGR